MDSTNPPTPTSTRKTGNAPTLKQAVEALAGVCDGAVRRDHHGFNAYDARIGHALALLPEDEWAPGHRLLAYRLLEKYRAQLAAMGIDYDQITPPPQRCISVHVDPIYGTQLLVTFEYDPELYQAVRALPRRFWRGNMGSWAIPLSGPGVAESLAELRKIAVKYHFEIAEGVREAVHSALANQTVPERR